MNFILFLILIVEIKREGKRFLFPISVCGRLKFMNSRLKNFYLERKRIVR
jgi:hypothetical protein